MEAKFELHPELKDASLEKACKMENGLRHTAHVSRTTVEACNKAIACIQEGKTVVYSSSW